jgi:Ran GTPase-activating protein (RanGAP) involved in mRNA processing and transport
MSQQHRVASGEVQDVSDLLSPSQFFGADDTAQVVLMHLSTEDKQAMRLVSHSFKAAADKAIVRFRGSAFGQLKVVARQWTQLHHLDMRFVGAKQVRELAKVQWPQLRSLDYSFCDLGPEGVAELVKASMPQLATLNISNNYLYAAGAEALMAASWPRLHTLNVSNNNLFTPGASHLAKCVWPELRSLDVSDNLLRKTGAGELASAAAVWPKLQKL